MRVLVTGHNGYVGSVMTQVLQEAGHEVVGLDTYLFEGCTMGPEVPDVPALRMDLRDVEPHHLKGVDAVVHLAALCNDPLGAMHKATTYEINREASVRLAEAAKAAGIERFAFASSCSLYGVAGTEAVTEESPFNPITAYGESKVEAEHRISPLADDTFSPTFLRNATAYGPSPRLRADIVINNLVGYAITTGEIVLNSDGSPWRPLLHVRDMAEAFRAVIEAPRDVVHNQAFNIGTTAENYQVKELVRLVQDAVPGTRARLGEEAGADPRSYKVDCSKLARMLPAAVPTRTVRQGIEELVTAYRAHGVTESEFFGPRFTRIKRIQALQADGRLDNELRWRQLATKGATE
jgi:nucleoside-diphosphate-sugar epimerase